MLTGGNGFLGKVLIGLLLDRYPEVGKLHILLRPRRNRTSEERFREEVLESPALRDLVARLGPAFLAEKVRVWEGDAARPFCGLEPGQIEGWQGRLDLILNCAGLVEFFPPVDESLRANVDSVEHLVELARWSGAKLLHVSTCYVAGRADGLIEETEPIEGFYPLRRGPDDRSFNAPAELARLREAVERLTAGGTRRDRDTLDQLTTLGRERAEQWGWVNTYTYSKSLGEQVLAASEGVSWTIVRPAIVESALRFPFPGWVEGGRTAAPLVLMALSGLRDWPVRRDLSLEIVPVDLIGAGIWIAAAALLQGQAAPVYQLAGSDVNPYEMERLLPLLASEARRRAQSGAKPRGPLRLLSTAQYRERIRTLRRRADTAERNSTTLARLLEQWGLPGSGALRERATAGRRLALQASFREQVLEQYVPFTAENRYLFEAASIRRTVGELRPEDREKLPWDPERIDWPRYWRENQIEGVLKWVQPEAVRDWSFQI